MQGVLLTGFTWFYRVQDLRHRGASMSTPAAPWNIFVRALGGRSALHQSTQGSAVRGVVLLYLSAGFLRLPGRGLYITSLHKTIRRLLGS